MVANGNYIRDMKNAAGAVIIDDASVGDMVDVDSLPIEVRRDGGGWVRVENKNGAKRWGAWRQVYVCNGAHKDGRSGWVCIEIRGDGR